MNNSMRSTTEFAAAIMTMVFVSLFIKRIIQDTFEVPKKVPQIESPMAILGRIKATATPILTGPEGTHIGKPEKIVIHIPKETPKKEPIPVPPEKVPIR